MEPASKTLRMALDGEASDCLKRMCQDVKSGRHPVKMNLSQLNSWVVVHFFKNHFQREKENIRREFLNQRQWLKKSLESAEDGELEGLLRDALKTIRPKRGQKEASNYVKIT